MDQVENPSKGLRAHSGLLHIGTAAGLELKMKKDNGIYLKKHLMMLVALVSESLMMDDADECVDAIFGFLLPKQFTNSTTLYS